VNNYISLRNVESLMWNDTLSTSFASTRSLIGEIVSLEGDANPFIGGLFGLGFASTSPLRQNSPIIDLFLSSPDLYPSLTFEIGSNSVQVEVGINPNNLTNVEINPVFFRSSWMVVSEKVYVNDLVCFF
jgi:hypothetical protein